MEITLRQEAPADWRAVEELTREAFWGFSGPGCDEHFLVHRLRQSPAFVPELDYVAEADGRLLGSILYSRARVTDGTGRDHPVLTFGPLSVLPACQGQGVGAALMRHTLLRARALGWGAVVFYGHPDYYLRFGFRPGAEFGITAPDGGSFDALQAMALQPGGLDGVAGRFYEDPCFEMDPAEAETFNRLLPPKAPAVLAPSEELLAQLPPVAADSLRAVPIVHLEDLKRFSGRALRQLPGVGPEELRTINRVLGAHGIAPRLAPDSPLLERAKLGSRLLEE